MSRTLLNKLLVHTFENYQLLFNDRTFHLHNAHHLGSLYYLGVSDDKMEKAYKKMCEDLDPYEESPQEITISNWRKHLGDKHYCKSYRDFFNQQLSDANNWQKRFMELLVDNPEQPLINSLVSGVVHPLIHVGYAFELNSQIVGVEALGMAAVCYNYLHEVMDKLKAPSSPSKNVLEIFKDIRTDIELPVYEAPDLQELEPVIKKYHDRIMFYYNQWKINKENLEKTIEELFDFSVYIYGATHKPKEIEYDFFLLHIVTGMNAIRSIFPHLENSQLMENMIQQFFYFTIAVYIIQARPEINEKLIHEYKIDEKKNNWDYVIDRTLNTKLIDDTHAVKVIRALRDADKTYGDKNGLYLKTAVKTVDNLDFDDPWIGGTSNKRQLNILKK